MKKNIYLICCSTFCELLVYKVLTKFTEDNVWKSNLYIDAVIEFRKDLRMGSNAMFSFKIIYFVSWFCSKLFAGQLYFLIRFPPGSSIMTI